MPKGSKGVRASAPKSRNGCLSCKFRRVKCDEVTPTCGPCERTSRSCEWKKAPSRTKAIIIPQSQSQSQSLSRIQAQELVQMRPSETLHFIDQREVKYFRAYQDETISELTGFSKSSVWSYTLLQSCYHEPFVLRGVVALGALNRALKTSHLAAICDAAHQEETAALAQQHKSFAIASYDKAIGEMQKIVPTDGPSLRKALLSCLLIFCIENFLQSPNVAIIQAQTGYQLMHNWIATKPQRKLGLGSPDSYVVEDEIFHEIAYLDLVHAMRWGVKELPRHSRRRQEGTATIQTMPSRFGHLDEARDYHDLLLRRTHHFIGEIYARIIAANLELRHPYTSGNPGEFVDPCLVPRDLFPEIDTHLADLQRFGEAFMPLLKKLLVSPDPLISCSAATIRICTLDAEISLAGSIFTSETCFDLYDDAFTEIVKLSRHITTLSSRMWDSSQPSFIFTTPRDFPLYHVACFCRIRAVRMEAVELLRETANRDSTGLQARMAIRAALMVSLEEDGRLPDGTIPEENRWRLIWNLNHYYDKENHLTLLCCRRVGWPLGDGYPAKREWKRVTYSRSEVEAMRVEGPWKEDMHWAPWPPRHVMPKPKCLAWREVHDELVGSKEKSRFG